MKFSTSIHLRSLLALTLVAASQAVLIRVTIAVLEIDSGPPTTTKTSIHAFDLQCDATRDQPKLAHRINNDQTEERKPGYAFALTTLTSLLQASIGNNEQVIASIRSGNFIVMGVDYNGSPLTNPSRGAITYYLPGESSVVGSGWKHTKLVGSSLDLFEPPRDSAYLYFTYD